MAEPPQLKNKNLAKSKTIHVKEAEITTISQGETDFISLTDMTSNFNEGSGLIGKWITRKNTLEYLSIRESINNVDFNYPESGRTRQLGHSRPFFQQYL